jgi:hypothetical protein
VLDLSGRSHLSCNLNIPAQRIGTFDTELVEHFFMSFANTSGEHRWGGSVGGGRGLCCVCRGGGLSRWVGGWVAGSGG